MKDGDAEGPDEDDLRTIAVVLRVIVSYDVHGHRRGEAVAVDRCVHGREVAMRLKGRKRRYRYPGLVSRPGVEKLGQSVLLMKEEDSEDFASLLTRLRVPYRLKRVWLRPVDLA